MKAGDGVFWFGLVWFVCVGLAILASLVENISTTISVPQATRQHTRERAMPDCIFIFFLEGGGGCMWRVSQLEKPCGENATIEREQSVIVSFHACLHGVLGMHEVCTLSVWREIQFTVDMEHVL